MAEIIVLRLVHVVGGIFWVGGALLNFLFIAPAFAAAGPAAGPIVAAMRARRMFVVLPTVAVLTLLSGLRLIMIQSNGFEAPYFATGLGRTFALGGAAATLAFVMGITIALPAQKRMAVLGPQIGAAPDDATRASLQAEMTRIQARLRVMGPIVTGLLLFAAITMAIGRYV